MPYPATPEDDAAIERLGTGHYNNDPVSPANPGGFDNGGYVTNLHAANGDVARAATFVGDAAEFAAARAAEARDKAAEAAGYVGKMSGTSGSQVAIGEGAKAFVTQAGKFFDPGRDIKIVSAANPSTHWMSGVSTAYANGTLTVEVADFEGAGSRADWIVFSTSRPGAAGTIEIAGVSAGAPDSAPAVVDEGSESAAVLRLTIPRGRPAGLPYTWSPNNAASDPGAGRIKVSSASLTAATEIYISETDRDGVAVAAEIASWDDSTSTVRGRLRLQDLADAANFAVYDVVGAIVDHGGWDTLRVVHVDHGGTIADAAKLVVQFRATGDRGEAGPSAYAVAVANGYPGTAEQWLASLVGNPGQPGQPGGQGPVGNPPAIVFNFDTGTNDADPGNGRVRFNNVTFGNVTAILFDNLDAFANTVANWLDTLDDSTNVGNKGDLTFVQVDNGARFAKFRVTGPVVDATGFRRVPVVHVDSAGALSGRVGVAFSPAGNQGANGNGAGNVVGPNAATVGRIAVFASADGKTIAQGPEIPTQRPETRIDIFDASGTWTKPAGAKRIDVLAQAPGSGGNSGERRASGTTSLGGGPGAGGGFTLASFDATMLPNEVPVAIGAPGVGGAPVTTDNTGGNLGTNGGICRFGSVDAAYQLSVGGGRIPSGVPARVAHTGGFGQTIGGAGPSGGGAGGDGADTSASLFRAGGGCLGAAQTPTPGNYNGGVSAPTASGYEGAAFTGSRGIGATKQNAASPASPFGPSFESFGFGGPGGWCNADGTAGAGANGQRGAGGGGGGGSLNGNPSGKGGDGGPGRMIVITHF